MNVIYGKKVEMTQMFDDKGTVHPGTLISCADAAAIGDLKEGDSVHVIGISKGKGFQGVVKRHGFHGGPRSHGQKHTERSPGSIGAGGYQKVFKGRKMAGRMGGVRVTVKNLKVLKIDDEKNELLISGAVPGRRGTRLEVRKSVKSRRRRGSPGAA